MKATTASTSLQERAVQEVDALHDFLEDWFSGTQPKTKAVFAQFADAIAPDFVIIGPDGSISTRDPVLTAVFNDWGRWRKDSNARIEIKQASFRQRGSEFLVVTYEEWHSTRAGTTARTSTVILREDQKAPRGLLWTHLHETWMHPDTEGE